jgi:hypothetical protein
MGHTAEILIGRTFSRLTVVSESVNTCGNKRKWKCICECGKHVEVQAFSLTSGGTKSCGCLRAELIAARNKSHGMSGTPVYAVWNTMLQRCHNPESRQWPDYGGRGVIADPSWWDFRVFLTDMGTPPFIGASLERVDNNLGYSKTNCVWADSVSQANNTRKNVYVTYNNETLTVAQWARKLGLRPGTIRHRLKAGWDTNQALNQKIGR